MQIEIEVNVKNGPYYDAKTVRKSATLDFESDHLTPETLNSAMNDAARKLASCLINSAIVERWQIEEADEDAADAAKEEEDGT